MLLELGVKIENMAVRITRTENRNESEYVSFDAKAFGVGFDHSFACQLRGGIQRRLHRKRMIFWRWNLPGFAVNRSGGRKRDPSDIIRAHGLKDVKCRPGVLIEILGRMFKAEAYVC